MRGGKALVLEYGFLKIERLSDMYAHERGCKSMSMYMCPVDVLAHSEEWRRVQCYESGEMLEGEGGVVGTNDSFDLYLCLVA